MRTEAGTRPRVRKPRNRETVGNTGLGRHLPRALPPSLEGSNGWLLEVSRPAPRTVGMNVCCLSPVRGAATAVWEGAPAAWMPGCCTRAADKHLLAVHCTPPLACTSLPESTLLA